MKQDLPPLRVYILAYNRPEYVLESLNSVLAQDYHPLEVVVSNNSTQKEVREVLEKVHDPRLKVIHREPSLPGIAHFNKLLDEAQSSQFFMLFHDDDKLLPDALKTLMQSFDSLTVAVGSNAFILKDKVVTQKLLAPNAIDFTSKNAGDLAEGYFNDKLWHAAFSSYIYRTASLTNTRMNIKRGGKYCDVTFLMDIAERGHVKMLATALMQYRLHASNDSGFFDLYASHSLKRALKKFKSISTGTLDDYFYKIVLRWAYQKKRSGFALKKRELLLFKKALKHCLLRPQLFYNAIKKKISKAS